MDRGRQKEIASKGGKAAHEKGSAHEWTTEEAREAGRKGGIASHRRKHELAGARSNSLSSAGVDIRLNVIEDAMDDRRNEQTHHDFAH